MNDLILRPAQEDDIQKVFDLANDPLVRSQSFSSEKILFSDHTQWFNKKIHDPNALLLIAEYGTIFLGQVRFDKDTPEQVTVGISIHEGFRGKGLSKILLERGIEYLKNTWPEVRSIQALIKEQNQGSVHLFENFHFQLQSRETLDTYTILKYILNI